MGIKGALRIMEDMAGGLSPLVKGLDESKLPDKVHDVMRGLSSDAPVEHIDIGDTPLPADDMSGMLAAAKGIKEQSKLKDWTQVDTAVEFPVTPGPTTFEVEKALSEALNDSFKPSWMNVFEHVNKKHGLNYYASEKIADMHDAGLISSDEVDALGAEWTPEIIHKQIVEDLDEWLGSNELAIPEEHFEKYVEDIDSGVIGIEDAKNDIAKIYEMDLAEDLSETLSEDDLFLMLPNYGIDMDLPTFQTELGVDWGSKLLKLVDNGVISEDKMHDFITGNSAKLKGMSLPPGLEATWDAVTDMFEMDVDQLAALAKSGKATAGKPQWLNMKNPNSPLTLQEQVGMVDYMPGYKNAAEWTKMLTPEEQQALSAMTYVRGQGFLKVAENIRSTKYGDRMDMAIEGSDYSFPRREAVAKLDDMDIASINWYTQRGDSVMNEALRNNADIRGSDLGEAINATVRALDNLPSWDLKDGEYVQRYISDPDIGRLYQAMEPGQEYIEKGFKSTTYRQFVDPKTGELEGPHFPIIIVTKVKPNGNGKAIEYLSEFEHEREVLFKPRTRFKFIKAQEFEPRIDKYGRQIDYGKRLVIFVEEM